MKPVELKDINLKYVNFGSRWNFQKNEDVSILDIFFKYDIVFFRSEKTDIRESAMKVKHGDIIIVTDGTKVKAFGKALSNAFLLDKCHPKYHPRDFFDDIDIDRFDPTSDTVAVKVALTRIPLSEMFEYGGQGLKFQNVQDIDCINKINQLYVEYH